MRLSLQIATITVFPLLAQLLTTKFFIKLPISRQILKELITYYVIPHDVEVLIFNGTLYCGLK